MARRCSSSCARPARCCAAAGPRRARRVLGRGAREPTCRRRRRCRRPRGRRPDRRGSGRTHRLAGWVAARRGRGRGDRRGRRWCRPSRGVSRAVATLVNSHAARSSVSEEPVSRARTGRDPGEVRPMTIAPTVDDRLAAALAAWRARRGRSLPRRACRRLGRRLGARPTLRPRHARRPRPTTSSAATHRRWSRRDADPERRSRCRRRRCGRLAHGREPGRSAGHAAACSRPTGLAAAVVRRSKANAPPIRPQVPLLACWRDDGRRRAAHRRAGHRAPARTTSRERLVFDRREWAPAAPRPARRRRSRRRAGARSPRSRRRSATGRDRSTCPTNVTSRTADRGSSARCPTSYSAPSGSARFELLGVLRPARRDDAALLQRRALRALGVRAAGRARLGRRCPEAAATHARRHPGAGLPDGERDRRWCGSTTT